MSLHHPRSKRILDEPVYVHAHIGAWWACTALSAMGSKPRMSSVTYFARMLWSVVGHDAYHEQSEWRVLNERWRQRPHAAQRRMQSVRFDETHEPCTPTLQSPPRAVIAQGPERGARR